MIQPCERCGKQFRDNRARERHMNAKGKRRCIPETVLTLPISAIQPQQRQIIVEEMADEIIFKEEIPKEGNEHYLNNISTWWGEIPMSEKFKFNDRINYSGYMVTPYMPQLINVIQEEVKNVIVKEMQKKGQIKSKLGVHCTYMITSKEEIG